ncbi:MAG: Rid family detoxifying hydrolase [Bacteroidia bacterium]|nr:Rid family detoxifying hydrolase [Bacteroidia bacterium]
MKKQIISTPSAPAAIGPYSQAILVTADSGEQTLYASGQIAIDPSTGNFVDGDIVAQTQQVLNNVSAILAAAGMDFSNVVKTTCMLSDIAEFSAFNEIYGSKFPAGAAPARSTFQVAALPKGAKVEVEIIAVK